jgi:hypothetical protein
VRTSISRGIASRAGQAPADLQSAASLDAFDAVILGTTTGVDQAAMNSLERYMRSQDGVVMILPGSAKDPALQQATGISQWQTAADPKGIRMQSDSATLITGETIRPAVLPSLATSVARDANGHAVVWSMPVGSGELIINGAVDAWRFRDPATSAFNAYWPGLLSAAVSNRRSAITLSSAVAAPRAEIEITAPSGNAQMHPIRASVTNETGYATSVPLLVEHLPVPGRIRLRGAFRAPSQPGTYTVSVADEAGGTRTSATATLVVTADARSIAPSPAILAAWADASGGRVIPSSRIADLRGDLRRRIPMSVQRVPWHPMRSPWWIVPFALALAAEWYWRRRRGLP